MLRSRFFKTDLNACMINQTIGSDAYVLGSERDPNITFLDISGNRVAKYLPRNVGSKFPNLMEYDAGICSLTIIRDYYFKDMRSVQHVDLSFNNIATIERGAFDDLVSLKKLDLHFNMIETLEENLFIKLASLETLYIDKNKIKYLTPTTFSTPGGKLRIFDWETDAYQFAKYFNGLLETYITPNITQDLLDSLIRKYSGFGK